MDIYKHFKIIFIIISLLLLINCNTDIIIDTNDSNTFRILGEMKGIKMGAAVDIKPLRNETLYRQTLSLHYNIITPENALKFDAIEPKPGQFFWDDADYIVNFALSNNMEIRGHTLVWHLQLGWLTKSNYSPAEVSNILSNHIFQVMGRYKGKIKYWDVINEAVNDNPDISDYLRKSYWWSNIGPDYIETVFKWAHDADPQALLFYNEYGCEGINGYGNKTKAVYALITNLLQKGVPIHGIGLQMHIDTGGYPLNDNFFSNLNLFTQTGLIVHITEMDVRIPWFYSSNDLAKQAKIYHDVLATCLSNTNVKAFLTWGFTDKYSWIPLYIFGYGSALPFDSNYKKKPAFYSIINALKGY